MANEYKKMIERFGIVTVMNVKVYKDIAEQVSGWGQMSPEAIIANLEATEATCFLDTLKISNLTTDGPNKTITGGRYSNPLIKWGKTGRCELQDALGNYKALEALAGVDVDTSTYSISIGERFPGPVALIGDNLFIDQKTGEQFPVKVIIYQFLPDAVTNLSQEAEGDATVFDLNGDIMTTEVLIDGKIRGEFYSIVDGSNLSTNIRVKEGWVSLAEGETEAVTVSGVVSATSGNNDIATVEYDNNQVEVTGVAVGKTFAELKDAADKIVKIPIEVYGDFS